MQSLLLAIFLAVDMGSSSTKVKEVDLETCEVIYDEVAEIDLMRNLEESGTGILTDDAVAKVVAFLEKAPPHDDYAAVATEAIRRAKNSDHFLEKIAKATEIEFRLIDREEEAYLGWIAAGSPRQPVLDLGSGSIEIATADATASIPLGSETFRNLIVREVKRENPLAVTSALPLSRDQIDQAIEIAIRESQKLAMRCLGEVIGMGGIGYFKESHYTPIELKAEIFASMEDPYLTNKILVYGLMEALGITHLRPRQLELTDGLIRQAELGSLPPMHQESKAPSHELGHGGPEQKANGSQ